MTTAATEIDIDIWRKLCGNEFAAKFVFADIDHQNGKISPYIARDGDILRLWASFTPNSNSESVSALLISLTLTIKIHEKNVTDSMRTIQIADKVTNILQGGCSIAMIPDLSWDTFDSEKSPTITLSMNDADSMWMGMRPLKPDELTFCIDWSKVEEKNVISESSQIWQKMMSKCLGTWWLWSPPLEIVSSPDEHHSRMDNIFKLSRKSKSPVSTLVVAYLYADKASDKFNIFIRAALHPLTSHQNSCFKVTEAKIILKDKDGGPFDSPEVILFMKNKIKDEKDPSKYSIVTQFTSNRKFEEVDIRTLPIVRMTLEVVA